MKHRILLILALVLCASLAFAASTVLWSPGQLFVSLTAVNATGAGDAAQFTSDANGYPTTIISWQTKFTGTPDPASGTFRVDVWKH